MDKDGIEKVIKKYGITDVYLLAALLSATAEKNPSLGWKLNMDGLLNLLDLAKDGHYKKLYWPSSIAVFGPTTPAEMTPQTTVMEPNTVYGISKLAGERWCEYYHEKYGVDVRSLRYPGLIGYMSAPGGGTTDYAVHIFHEALNKGKYESFLSAETKLPMMYMPDAIKATIGIMQAPAEKVKIRSSYNVGAFSFTPKELAKEIAKHVKDFNISYKPDSRQKIADSWPKSVDDTVARNDWGWKPDYSLEQMTEDMIKHIAQKKH
jgi:nucleoside-diphosphate-sugar epimerase